MRCDTVCLYGTVVSRLACIHNSARDLQTLHTYMVSLAVDLTIKFMKDLPSLTDGKICLCMIQSRFLVTF